MALEMKTHKDVAAYEAKPMFGRTWRQLGAIALMIFGGGAVFFAVASAVLATSGTSWDAAISAGLESADAPAAQALSKAGTAGMLAMFLVIFPLALWAWVRPMGIKPEEYAQYFFRHQLTSKVINYEDTYAHATAERPLDELDEPVPSAARPRVAAQQPAGKARRRTDARLRRSLSEHAEGTPQRARRRR